VIGAGKAEVSPRYLSEDDRVRIADLRRAGLGVRAIAAVLGRSPSTVSKELRRNCEPGSGQYRPFAAQRLAARRRARPGRGKLNADPVLRQFVAGRLEKRWSPEQISQALRAEFPVTPSGTWCTRRSTRLSTGRSWAGCAAACPPCCGPVGGTASRIAAPAPAGPGR
jgi:IS30 family transposase